MESFEIECPICLNPLTDRCISLTCQHKYHEKCIARWIRRRPDCPLCRQGLTCEKREELMMISNQERYQQHLRRLAQQQRERQERQQQMTGCCCFL